MINDLRDLRYGNDDYIWVADYNSVLISHPSPDLHGFDASKLRDVHGVLIVKPMVEQAIENGEGFYTYWWQRLGKQEPSEKISYFINIPELQMVIGTGLYVDDVEQEVKRRKEQAIETLRKQLREVKIANTGYVYIYNGSHRMIIHPNSNIENRNFQALLDPISKQPMVKLLREVSDEELGLTYKWDKPSDPGNYVYEKISWVKSFPPFDWYIASSIYTEELNKGNQQVGQRILVITLSFLLLATVLGFLFTRYLTTPILRLSRYAKGVANGDLTQKEVDHRDDEIGDLAKSFNLMVKRLGDDMEYLDLRIKERTGELEKANQSKSRFLAAASHDLRQPLNSMGLFLNALTKRVSSPEEVEILKNLTKSFHALTELLDALLDMSKLDAGILKFHIEPVAISPIFESLIRYWKPLALEKGIELHIVKSSAIVISDEKSLERMLGNLVSNAVRYTEQGKIVVGCRINKGTVRVEVWDTGRGIPYENQSEVFDEFVQLNNPSRDKTMGLGLGLSIVKHLAKQLGHRVTMTSKVRKGTKFTIELPLHSFEKNNLERNQVVSIGTANHERTVLIVDDDTSTLLGMAILVDDWGWNCVTASTGNEALSKLKQEDIWPDAIVADYRLTGDEKGPVIIDEIRKNSGFYIPAIIVTGDTSPERLRELEKSGFDVLHKPIQPRSLGSILRYFFRKNRENITASR